MSKFEKYLLEKTHELDEDVDYIYSLSNMDKFLTAIKNIDSTYISKVLKETEVGNEFEFASLKSEDLKTDTSIRASKIKPITIRIGIFEDGSYYKPSSKYNTMQISLNKQAFSFAKNMSFDRETIENILNNQSTRFFNEFSPHSVKATIYHELTHWTDDALHNNFIANKISKAKETNNSNVLRGKDGEVNHTSFEVNSQVHAVKQIKRELTDIEFNSITWENLFQKKASIMSNFKNFKSESDYTDFVNKFVSRLYRENILPRAMRKIPSWSEMNRILASV